MENNPTTYYILQVRRVTLYFVHNTRGAVRRFKILPE